MTLMVLDRESTSASRLFSFLPLISVQNVKGKGAEETDRRDGRETPRLILFALQISVSESPALPSRLITPSPMKLVTVTEWLPTFYNSGKK